MARQGDINTGWDRRVLDLCSEGKLAEALAWDDGEVLTEGGNGAHELRNWVAALACADGRPAEVLAYEPVTEWLTGMAVVDVPGLLD
jgi:protocatechuate 4,5-dioxygenase beta chain